VDACRRAFAERQAGTAPSARCMAGVRRPARHAPHGRASRTRVQSVHVGHGHGQDVAGDRINLCMARAECWHHTPTPMRGRGAGLSSLLFCPMCCPPLWMGWNRKSRMHVYAPRRLFGGAVSAHAGADPLLDMARAFRTVRSGTLRAVRRSPLATSRRSLALRCGRRHADGAGRRVPHGMGLGPQRRRVHRCSRCQPNVRCVGALIRTLLLRMRLRPRLLRRGS